MTDRTRCEATTRSGERCRAFAMPNSDRCRVHGATDAQRRAWASKGGNLRSRGAVEEWADSDSPRDRARWLSQQLAEVFADVRHGELEPKVAHCLAAVANALRGSLAVEAELGDLADAIAALEAKLGERDA